MVFAPEGVTVTGFVEVSLLIILGANPLFAVAIAGRVILNPADTAFAKSVLAEVATVVFAVTVETGFEPTLAKAVNVGVTPDIEVTTQTAGSPTAMLGLTLTTQSPTLRKSQVVGRSVDPAVTK